MRCGTSSTGLRLSQSRIKRSSVLWSSPARSWGPLRRVLSQESREEQPMTNRKGARPPVVLLALYGLLGHILSVPDVGYAQGAIDQGYKILEGARLSGWLSDYVQEYSADPIMQPIEDVEAITVDADFRPVYRFSGPFLSGAPIVAPSNAVGGVSGEMVLGTLLYHHAPIGVGFFAIPRGGSTPQSLNRLWDLEQSKILWSTMQADDLVVYLPPVLPIFTRLAEWVC